MAPNPIDLSNLSAVKNWASVVSTGDDATIQSCLTAFSMAWLSELSAGPADGSVPSASPFNSVVEFIENYDGNGSDRMFLTNRPIQSVKSLVVNGITISASAAWNAPGFVVDKEKQSIQIRGGGGGQGVVTWPGYPGFGSGQFFAKGIQNITIDYLAGFNPTNVPNELDAIPASGTPSISVALTPWFSDNGVSYFSTGLPLARVLSAPSPGQYFIQANGQYLFNVADAGKQVLISYTATGVPFDIQEAVNDAVATNYTRRKWIDLKSNSMASGMGTTSFRDWRLSPRVMKTILSYQRFALV
jgi:hypothetical protein